MSIEEEWNRIAHARLIDRLNGNDTSYNDVLLPKMCNRVSELKDSTINILDFGCGTGELTYEISKIGKNICGLDISKHSIELARKYFENENLYFVDKSLFETNFSFKFDIIIANMSLMDIDNIEINFSEICRNLTVGGKILIIITHPAFWPIYWNYCDDNFSYIQEKKITKTYKTSNTVFEGFKTSHYHRPISAYFNLFKENKLKLLDVQELRNSKDKHWYPRFMYFELEK
ncbi:class I SAM-dependent methyltransferase [Spirosoma spitsbergense]|uniref:class I SAM-dependent methyltransferase n=1 Tax=Spirosoma spitsbergense TaxID=431554 RepID=UPI00036D0FEE|nr:class I SAM-dependent methyltransferase [Spirosoma spitsbergense]